LARRGVRPGTIAAELRQATAARLSGGRTASRPMVGRLSAARTARRGGGCDQHTLSRRVPSYHRGRPRHRGAVMNFAREGLAFIIVAAVIAAAGYAAALTRRSWPLLLLAFALTLVALWVAYFFRDPERSGARGDRLIIAPADGKVVMITEVDEPAFVHGRSTRVSIFMNVFNVHVNRYPASGTVKYVHRSPGKFLNAAAE